MQYEGENSVVQEIFTKKEIMCVVHPSSVLFSSSRNQQSLMSVSFCAWLWDYFQVVIAGLYYWSCFQYRRGRARSMPILICAPKVIKNFGIFDRLNQWLPSCGDTTEKGNKQSVPVYSLTGAQSTAPDREKKITWLNRASASMTHPRDWEECLRIEKEGACFTPGCSLKSFIFGSNVNGVILMLWLPVLQPLCMCLSREGGNLLSLCLVELPGRHLPAAPPRAALHSVCPWVPLCCTAFQGLLGKGAGSRDVRIHVCFKAKPRLWLHFLPGCILGNCCSCTLWRWSTLQACWTELHSTPLCRVAGLLAAD